MGTQMNEVDRSEGEAIDLLDKANMAVNAALTKLREQSVGPLGRQRRVDPRPLRMVAAEELIDAAHGLLQRASTWLSHDSDRQDG